jgi:dinuclear metal center YbgI/SA1388 family protein
MLNMPAITKLIDHLDRLLDADAFRDYGPNGLQVPGAAEVQTVVTGVSANGPLIDRAVALGADLVVVHHGLFWKGDPQQITPLLHRRLKPLFDHDVALAAYHLPLDAHPEHGNNALLAQALGAQPLGTFADHGGRDIGLQVRFAEPLTIDELTARVRTAVGGREPLVVAGGPPEIRTLGIVTGAASDDMLPAIDLGLDAFLTGEPAERAFSIATDAGIHFLAAGHHATETFGVRRLGELLAAEFGVTHHFVDVENPI